GSGWRGGRAVGADQERHRLAGGRARAGNVAGAGGAAPGRGPGEAGGGLRQAGRDMPAEIRQFSEFPGISAFALGGLADRSAGRGVAWVSGWWRWRVAGSGRPICTRPAAGAWVPIAWG